MATPVRLVSSLAPALLGGLLAALLAAPLRAQRPDSVRAADSLRVLGDSAPRFERIGAPAIGTKPPISSRKAFLYSFLVPGLGQARLNRPNGGALFAAIEMGAVFMAFKSRDDLRYAERAGRGPVVETWAIDPATGLPRVVTGEDGVERYVLADTALNRYAGTRIRARRVHYEDWIAVLAFNHLFAGADAFVAAQLWDMPVRGSVRAIDRRRALVGATLEFGRRAPR